MTPLEAVIPILVFILFMSAVAAGVVITAIRYSKPIDLVIRRFYLAPEMSLQERQSLLDKAKKESGGHRFYNYYVVLPNQELPLFSPTPHELAEAEFMIVEYLEPETVKRTAA